MSLEKCPEAVGLMKGEQRLLKLVFTNCAKAKRGLNYANPLCILMALFKAFSNERPADS